MLRAHVRERWRHSQSLLWSPSWITQVRPKFKFKNAENLKIAPTFTSQEQQLQQHFQPHDRSVTHLFFSAAGSNGVRSRHRL